MGKTYVMGDIHGAYRALRQCLERSNFDYNADHLIFLGDVCDGWPDTRLCVNELLNIKHLTFILGNHDWWMLDWMRTGHADEGWRSQGGASTVASYAGDMPDAHVQLIRQALPYYVWNNCLFVHAGILTDYPPEDQPLHILLFDRSLARRAQDAHRYGIRKKFTAFDEVFLGHTPVPGRYPIRGGEVWLMDSGAGWDGVLSMMDLDTQRIFTSDPVPDLYPGIVGRQRRG